MLFAISCLALLIIMTLVFHKAGVANPISKGMALGIALSILATICLSQNYTQSLIPNAQDGIGISNNLVYWIIGEDGWSYELFKNYFQYSLYLSLILILMYPLVLLIESRMIRKHGQA